MTDYIAPEFNLDGFNCPHCGAFAHQIWRDRVDANNRFGMPKDLEELTAVTCSKCDENSYWINNRMVYPSKSLAPLASLDMPEDVVNDYNEARSIFEKSPRSAAALLRLAIQKLCVTLGESGKNINGDIAFLVKKGLPVRIQMALDVVRVVGNNAVHPGEISIDDNPAIALSLFTLINIIVDAMISQPKEIEKLFQYLPQGAKNAIEKRDSK